MNDENPELAEGADAQPEDQTEAQAAEQSDAETDAETPQDIAGDGGSADPEDEAVDPAEPTEEKIETEPFRETVAEAAPEQPAHDVVTPTIEDEDLSQQHPDEEDETETSAPTRTFFGREYEQAENGALRQTSR